MFFNEKSLGTFKITLKDTKFIHQAITLLKNNNITENIGSVSTTEVYNSDIYIYIELVSKHIDIVSNETLIKIKNNILKIINYEISNFSFSKRKYSEDKVIEIIPEIIEEKRRPSLTERLYNYILK